MSNIASGYLSIKLADTKAVFELSAVISNTDLFEYGGDADIQNVDETINIGFSCSGSGESCWDWIDAQMSDSLNNSSASIRRALISSEIWGYTFEHGCQHRDRVKKSPGERKLERQQANIPCDIITALKLSKSFDLSPGEDREVSGGVVTLLSKAISEENKNESLYAFSIVCGYTMEVTLCVDDLSISSEVPKANVVEINLEDWDPSDDDSYEDTSMFKEIIDDMVADIDEIYE